MKWNIKLRASDEIWIVELVHPETQNSWSVVKKDQFCVEINDGGKIYVKHFSDAEVEEYWEAEDEETAFHGEYLQDEPGTSEDNDAVSYEDQYELEEVTSNYFFNRLKRALSEGYVYCNPDAGTNELVFCKMAMMYSSFFIMTADYDANEFFVVTKKYNMETRRHGYEKIIKLDTRGVVSWEFELDDDYHTYKMEYNKANDILIFNNGNFVYTLEIKTKTLRKLSNHQRHEGTTSGFAQSGDLIAYQYTDSSSVIQELSTGKILMTIPLNREKSPELQISISTNGELIAYYLEGQEIYFKNIVTQEEKRVYIKSKSSPTRMVFNNDDTHLFVIERGGDFFSINIPDYTITMIKKATSIKGSAHFDYHPDKNLIALKESISDKISFLDAATNSEKNSLRFDMLVKHGDIRFSKDYYMVYSDMGVVSIYKL